MSEVGLHRDLVSRLGFGDHCADDSGLVPQNGETA